MILFSVKLGVLIPQLIVEKERNGNLRAVEVRLLQMPTIDGLTKIVSGG